MPPAGFEPFLATILDDPESDGPRMVYADWLEEHGDPRGEFIRIQLELARIPPEDPQRDRLTGREQVLLSAHREQWQTEIPEWARPQCDFHRGFVNEVAVFTHWRRHFGPELSCLAPVERVMLHHVRGTLDEFAEGPEVRRLSRLALLDARATHDDIWVLCQSATACGSLRCLELMDVGLADTGALYFALCKHLVQLIRLELVRCKLDDRGAIRLAESNQMAALRELDLSDNQLSDAAFGGVVKSPTMGQLTHLGWYSNDLTIEGLQMLVDNPAANGLTHLDLADNRLNDPAARLLMEHFPNLHFLNLARNGLTNGMMMQLSRFYGRRVRVGVPGE